MRVLRRQGSGVEKIYGVKDHSVGRKQVTVVVYNLAVVHGALPGDLSSGGAGERTCEERIFINKVLMRRRRNTETNF